MGDTPQGNNGTLVSLLAVICRHRRRARGGAESCGPPGDDSDGAGRFIWGESRDGDVPVRAQQGHAESKLAGRRRWGEQTERGRGGGRGRTCQEAEAPLKLNAAWGPSEAARAAFVCVLHIIFALGSGI